MIARAFGAWRTRLGWRFLAANLVVLGIAIVMILLAARAMFISDQDLSLLTRVLVAAVGVAAVAAYLLARPVARDARRIADAAAAVAAGDLDARTGVDRRDELGEAAAMFDEMVVRLGAVERERSLLLSSISHDLRTPLAALRASVEALRDGVAPDPQRYLTGMEQQVKALAVLVDDLHLHSRLESGTLELRTTRTDVTELVDEAIETLRPIAEQRSVRLRLDAPERVVVDADSGQLGRVVRNLLDNAIRHSPDDSEVRADVLCLMPAGRPPVAVVRVTDEGLGFPDDFRARAFEPFTRADAARNVATGTAGLGLSIARGIVVAHGGTIAIGDGPGGVVEFRLPA